MGDSKSTNLIGGHVSIAGGLSKAPIRGGRRGCNAIQIFTKAPGRWQGPPIPEEEIHRFKENVQTMGIHRVLVHNAYLINLASPDPDLYLRSQEAMVDEVFRCAALGIPSLVTHPGAHMGQGLKQGVQRIVKALKNILTLTEESGVDLLLETTAGMGSSIGHRFEHLAQIIEGLNGEKRIKVCIDTCHLHAAGYDVSKKSSFENHIFEFDRTIGIDRLACFHLNDSKGEVGSRIDRHEHIGKGTIGIGSFRSIVRDKRFNKIPKIIETPGGVDHDANLDLLFSFIKKS